jgi:hypothetical protein
MPHGTGRLSVVVISRLGRQKPLGMNVFAIVRAGTTNFTVLFQGIRTMRDFRGEEYTQSCLSTGRAPARLFFSIPAIAFADTDGMMCGFARTEPGASGAPLCGAARPDTSCTTALSQRPVMTTGL